MRARGCARVLLGAGVRRSSGTQARARAPHKQGAAALPAAPGSSTPHHTTPHLDHAAVQAGQDPWPAAAAATARRSWHGMATRAHACKQQHRGGRRSGMYMCMCAGIAVAVAVTDIAAWRLPSHRKEPRLTQLRTRPRRSLATAAHPRADHTHRLGWKDRPFTRLLLVSNLVSMLPPGCGPLVRCACACSHAAIQLGCRSLAPGAAMLCWVCGRPPHAWGPRAGLLLYGVGTASGWLCFRQAGLCSLGGGCGA